MNIMAIPSCYSLWTAVLIHLLISCSAHRRGDMQPKQALHLEFSNSIESLVKEVKSLRNELPILEGRILERVDKAEISFRDSLLKSIIPSVIEKIVNQTISRIMDVSDDGLNSDSKGLNEGSVSVGRIQQISDQVKSLGEKRGALIAAIEKLEEERSHLEIQVGNMKEELLRTKYDMIENDLPVYNASHNSTRNIEHVCTSLKGNFDAAMKSINRNFNLTNSHLKTISKRLNRTSTCGHFNENQIQNDFGASNGSQLTSLSRNQELKEVISGNRKDGSAGQRSDEELKRILVMPRATEELVHPYLIHLHYNTFSVYRHLRTSRVNCATYDPTTDRIVFSRYRPYGIFSSKVGVDRLEILRDNVGSTGMAVDAGRKLIFMTTLHPRKTVSKMDTDGKHFRGILDLDGPRSHAAFSLAIDEEREVIYFAQFNRLVSVGYDGNNLEELESGRRRIYAVAFDPVAHCLYFSQHRRVIRKNLKNAENSDVIEMVDPTWKILLHNGSLFLSSFKGVGIDVVNINPGHNVHFNLWKMKHNNNDIVLMP